MVTFVSPIKYPLYSCQTDPVGLYRTYAFLLPFSRPALACPLYLVRPLKKVFE